MNLFIKTAATYSLVAIYRLIFLVTPKNTKSAKPSKKALIIRLDNIGDFLLWKNSADILINHLHSNGYEVSLLANSAWAKYAVQTTSFDSVISYNPGIVIKKKSLGFSFLKKMNQENFDLVINPMFTRDILMQDPIVFGIDSNEKIGFNGDTTNLNHTSRFLTPFIYTKTIQSTDHNQHETLTNAYFLRSLGIQETPNIRPKLQHPSVNKFLLPSNYVVIATGTSWSGKKWPTSSFKEISKWLRDEFRLPTIAIGSNNDKTESELILNQDLGDMNLCGLTELSDLPQIISNSKLVISNDSAAIHFAFATGAPAICILGGGHFGRFLPFPNITDGLPVPISVSKNMDCFNCKWKCIYKRQPSQAVKCIEDISTYQVKKQIQLLLNDS